MPRTVDLFLDSDQPLDRFADYLADLTGCQFQGCPGRTRFAMQDGDVTAFLAEHDFLDDEDLPLSEFRFVLSAVVRGDGNIEATPETACLRRVNARLRDDGRHASLLVLDLERPDSLQVGPCD